MSKLTNNFPIIAGAPVTTTDIQGNITSIARAIGNLESRQLKADCVGVTELGDFDTYDFTAEPGNQVTVKSPLNTWVERHYYQSAKTTANIKLLPDGTYSPGWNNISIANSNYGSYDYLVMPPTPGRVFGAATIDSELRYSIAFPYSPAHHPYANDDLYWEFGVFANGTEVGRSPRLLAGRHSITVPFSLFSGPETITLQLKFRVHFGRQQGQDSTARNVEPLVIHNYHMWANGSSK